MMSGWFTAVEAIPQTGVDIKSKLSLFHYQNENVSKGGDIHMWLLSVTETWWLMSESAVFVTRTGGCH